MNAGAFALISVPPVSAGTITYDCTFPTSTGPGSALETGAGLSFVFTMDDQTRTAFITGNNGVTEVFPVIGYKGITFVEPLDSGATQTTTIDAEGNAVHSRHSIMLSLVPSQYYGFCSRS